MGPGAEQIALLHDSDPGARGSARRIREQGACGGCGAACARRGVVSGSSDGTIRLWDAVSRQPIGNPLIGHRSGVKGVGFNPGGREVLSVGARSTTTTGRWPAGTRSARHAGAG
ncbi:hypothetical protein [Nocardia sp. NPDC051981]|uniref:hypothetical protein n=1 Tax=Nocardia sp. NPDC051981 TaxID=3155417 RepID=UPI00341DD309